MNIKYKDINAISYALCIANAMLDTKIELLEKRDPTMQPMPINREKKS